MIIGKSNLYRKKDMVKCGGMRQFAKYMSEDNEIGKALMNLGLHHQIAPEFAFQSLGYLPFGEFLKRRIRWIRIRKYVVFIATMIEPSTEFFFSIYISSLLFHSYFDISQIQFALYFAQYWIISDFIMLLLTFSPRHGHFVRDLLGMVGVWALREVIALPVWMMGMLGTEIQWRGARYHCNSDGTGSPISSRED